MNNKTKMNNKITEMMSQELTVWQTIARLIENNNYLIENNNSLIENQNEILKELIAQKKLQNQLKREELDFFADKVDELVDPVE